MPNSEHCPPGYLCTGLHAVNNSGILPTQVLSFVSESLPSLAQADDHRAKAVLRAVRHLKCYVNYRKHQIGGPKPGDCRGPGGGRGRWHPPGWAAMPATGRVLADVTGVTDTRRSLRILADYLYETAQVTGHRAADLAERGEAVPAAPLLPGAHWGSPSGHDSSGTVSD